MRAYILVAVFFLTYVCSAVAAPDVEGYDSATIRVADVPTNAPAFEAYPAKIYVGRNANLRLGTDPDSKLFSTRLKHWSKIKPNFAGHYILSTLGCGTNCTQLAIIDAKTGNVFHPPGISAIDATNVQQELLDGGDMWHPSGSIKFRTNSKLLVLIGAPEEDSKRRGISYYRWNHNQLTLVRYVPKP